jgi:crotonobetainyl-CoA:carnitine CoA-transferase CaiB-like acyl-CoA transferase
MPGRTSLATQYPATIAAPSNHNSGTSMLTGLKVLDLSRVLAGPLCTMMLGDLGASVIKVERPSDGDETRGWGPPFDDRGESAYFLAVNRNKLSVALDFANPGDLALVQQLARGADVVVDNFRAGSLERLGLDPAKLLAENPGLVWCSITGFANDPARPGYDFVVQAERGWMAATGEVGGEPMKSGMALADVIAGKDAAIAILAAVARPPAEAARRHLRIALDRSAAAALVNVAQNVLVSGNDAKRHGNAHPNLVPYQLFATADRPIVVAVGSDAQWRACALALDLGALASDAALVTNAGRIRERERVVSALSARLLTASAAEWSRRLSLVGVPCGLVKTVSEALREVDSSPLTGVEPSVPGSIRFAPPLLDEHGDTVRRLGWRAFE